MNTARAETLRYVASNDVETAYNTFDADFEEDDLAQTRTNITDNTSCESFRLCATNTEDLFAHEINGAECLTMTASFLCEGCDPLTGECTFPIQNEDGSFSGGYATMQLKNYKENSLRQQLTYNLTGKNRISSLKSPDHCMSLLILNDQYFIDPRDPCEESFEPPHTYGGTYVYSYPCQEEDVVWQRWVFEDGLVKSQCPHGYVLAEAFPFLMTSNDTSQQDTNWLEFSSQTSIEKKFSHATEQILPHFVNDTILVEVLQHGCWCRKLVEGHDLGGHFVYDDLDEICKRWVQARNCIKHPRGDCEDGFIGNYTFGNNPGECPWEEVKPFCGLTEAHFGNSECCKATCEIDTGSGDDIQKWIESNPDWEKIVADPNKCGCPDCPPGPGGFGAKSLMCCYGEAPNVELRACE